jgi:hypothetical protein
VSQPTHTAKEVQLVSMLKQSNTSPGWPRGGVVQANRIMWCSSPEDCTRGSAGAKNQERGRCSCVATIVAV